MAKKVSEGRFYFPSKSNCHLAVFGETGCLDEDTEILIWEGFKQKKRSLKDLPQSFYVISFNFKNRRFEIKTAIKIDSGLKECWEIKLKGEKKIIASSEHVFFDKNNKEIMVSDLSIKNKILHSLLINKIDEPPIKTIEIESIKKIGLRKTFDLKVMENNNFFLANGILSHNSGKSGSVKVITEIRYENKWKIFDLYDGASEENCFWCLESNHKFWGGGSKRLRSPRSFPTRIYTPIILSKLRDKTLPKICQLFTIPIYSLTLEDIKSLLGKQVGISISTLWGAVSKKIKPNTTGEEFLELLKESTKEKKHSREVGAGKLGLKNLYGIIEPLVREGLLSNMQDPFAIDLEKELKDKTTIAVLMLKYAPINIGNVNLRSFLVHYIINKIFEIKQSNEGALRKIRTQIIMRESEDFLNKGSAQDLGESDLAIRDKVIQVFKQGRKFGLFALIDAQTPSNLHPKVKGQFKIVLVHRIGDYGDLEEVVSPSVKDQVTTELKLAIGELPTQWVVVLKPREKRIGGQMIGRGAFITKMVVPRSRLMEQGEDFLQIYKKIFPEDCFETNFVLKEYIQKKKEINKKIDDKYVLEEKTEKTEKKIKKMNPEDREARMKRLKEAFMNA